MAEEFLTLRHPEAGQTEDRAISRTAYEEVWKEKGWIIVGPESALPSSKTKSSGGDR
jgi:hypothetical protein